MKIRHSTSPFSGRAERILILSGAPLSKNDQRVTIKLEDYVRTRPVPVITPAKATPICIRLPEPGDRCWWTGMSRERLLALIAPSLENGYKPPVKSIVHMSHRGKVRLRLIHFESLKDYLDSQASYSTV